MKTKLYSTLAAAIMICATFGPQAYSQAQEPAAPAAVPPARPPIPPVPVQPAPAAKVDDPKAVPRVPESGEAAKGSHGKHWPVRPWPRITIGTNISIDCKIDDPATAEQLPLLTRETASAVSKIKSDEGMGKVLMEAVASGNPALLTRDRNWLAVWGAGCTPTYTIGKPRSTKDGVVTPVEAKLKWPKITIIVIIVVEKKEEK